MLAFPPHLAIHDIPHLGVLYKRVREARGLSQTDIASALGVTNSTISKFESTGRSRRDQIVERYIRALEAPVLNGVHRYAPLSMEEAALLRQLSPTAHNGSNGSNGTNGNNSNGHAPAVQLSAYDFALITSPHAPAELKALVHKLRQTPWPAFIADGLWFVHAVNGAMWNLFGIAPDDPLLRRWESWQMVAAKFTDPSPIRAAHISPDNYFPPTICAFFQSTLPYLFTPQMRALLRNLHQLSLVNQLHFSTWWYLASSFNLSFDLSQSARILRRGDRFFHTTIRGLELHMIPITTAQAVPYFLGVWEPLGADTQAGFARLSGAAAPDALFFASQYDVRQNFHVNCWPETEGEVPLTI
jgi:hypothetical protein